MLQKIIYRFVNFGYPMFKLIVPHQVYLYLTTGAINTALNIGLFTLFAYLCKDYFLVFEISTLLSFFITVYTGFWFSKNFAFKQIQHSSTAAKHQFKKYAIVAMQGQVNGYLIAKLFIILFTLKPVLAYTITTIIMLTINYCLQKYFTFSEGEI